MVPRLIDEKAEAEASRPRIAELAGDIDARCLDIVIPVLLGVAFYYAVEVAG